MRLEEALAVESGEYVMSPYTATPAEPMRVTQKSISASGRAVFFRVHALAEVTAMAGGWIDAKSVFRAPPGYKFERTKKGGQYVRYKKDQHGDRVVADRLDTAPMIAMMLRELRELRAQLDREEATV